MNKTVDIIIPTYKPDQKFEKLLARLAEQKYPVQWIHIINTNVGNFREEVVGKYHNVKVTHIRADEFDHGATRNMGALSSTADIIVYMTQDALPADNEMISQLVEPLEQDNRIAATYGRQIANADCEIIERYTRSFNYPNKSSVKTQEDLQKLGIKTFFCSNVCAAYRRDIYVQQGGFVKNAIFNEDMIYAGGLIKNGYKIAYCAHAMVYHSHNYSCIGQMKRNFDLAVSQKMNPQIFEGVASEKEGIRLVGKTIQYLCKKKKPYLIPYLFVKSGFKYIGYFMGKRYERIPYWLLLKISLNPIYWIKLKKMD